MPMGSAGDLPSVSVIIPMLNELGFIEACIDGIDVQTYPADLIEILVVDGGSTDGSRELVGRMAAADSRIRLLDNPRVLAAAAANVGIAEATTDVLCFLSAHGVAEPDYIELSVRALLETGAVGVGGRYCHEGLDPKSTAIGMAMASPFGMASPHRVATERTSVDTISHPVFLRQPLVDVGGYDETLLRNEDYELNFRLRQAGGDLVFTPEISTVYRPRGSILALAKQFFAYGRGKTSVLAKHPSAFRFRHVVPPAAVLFAATAGPLFVAGPKGRVVVATGSAAYALVLGAATLRSRPWRHAATTGTFVVALPIIHVTWGAGVWAEILARLARRGMVDRV